MFFKKLRIGLDMRGNKIINTNVDNPITNKEISNKEYVDLGDTFNTQNSLIKQNSTKFNWMTNLSNLSIKQVLDKLLFPVIYPTYLNPILKNYKLYNLGEKSNVFGNNINGKLIFDINIGSRTPTLNYKLIITYSNNTQSIFESNTNIILFDFNFKNISSIKLKQIYSPVIIQNDSDGNPYIDNNFLTTYDFEYNFDIEEFINIFNINKSIYYHLNIDNSNLNTFLSYDETNIKNNFIYNNLINLEFQNESDLSNKNNTLILIHETLINKFCNILFYENSKLISNTEIKISKNFIYDEQNQPKKVLFSDGYYYFVLINFGKYKNNINVLITF